MKELAFIINHIKNKTEHWKNTHRKRTAFSKPEPEWPSSEWEHLSPENFSLKTRLKRK